MPCDAIQVLRPPASCFRSKRRTRHRHKFLIDISTRLLRQKKREFLTKLFLVPFSCRFCCFLRRGGFFFFGFVLLPFLLFSRKIKNIFNKKGKNRFSLFFWRLKLRAKKNQQHDLGSSIRVHVHVCRWCDGPNVDKAWWGSLIPLKARWKVHFIECLSSFCAFQVWLESNASSGLISF